jgi:alkylhydroperoxidase family enzyme
MARIPYINPDTAPAELQPTIELIKRERGGRVSNLFSLLLNSPPIAEGWIHMGSAVRFRGTLDGAIREMAICRVALMNGADYEFQAHAPFAIKDGATQAQIDALGDWSTSDAYTPAQRVALELTDAMTTKLDADDALFSSVREHFNERDTLELVTTIGFYNMVSRVLRTMRVDLEAH